MLGYGWRVYHAHSPVPTLKPRTFCDGRARLGEKLLFNPFPNNKQTAWCPESTACEQQEGMITVPKSTPLQRSTDRTGTPEGAKSCQRPS